MPSRTSNAQWQGDLKSGSGEMSLGSGAWSGKFSAPSRFEDGSGTNPEELIAAAHAGCFSMALSHMLSSEGHKPDSVETRATVHIEKEGDGFAIPKIELATRAKVPGIDQGKFQEIAGKAKNGCPVSKVLAGADITLDAQLV
ncbi:MAG: OsmC family protein [Geminicoccaceae bacterium]|nr:OsmC family protein [Geminicoccaceae bacterium]